MKTTFSLLSIHKRLLTALVVIAFIFMALFARLFFVQIIYGKTYSARAVDQWTRDLPLEAKRGSIFDRNGNALAVCQTTYNVYVRPNAVKDATSVARVLSDVLGVSFEKAYTLCSTKGVSEALVKMQATEAQMQAIVDANALGVYFSQNIQRYYPYGDLLTQVLGYLSIDNQGQSGLEAFYDYYLKGINGKALTEGDLIGRELDDNLVQYLPSIDGNSLYTSLDLSLQVALENVLEVIMQKQEAKGAYGILMNPNTGEILAMSNKPSFDLNNVPRDDLTTMLDQSKNKTVVDVYEPGSTFKILTMAAALEENITTENEVFYDPGYRIVDGDRIKCWRTIGHGSQTLTEGFCNSCNSVFMDLALRLGTDKFYEYLEKFGVNSTTEIDFLGESSGILMPISQVKNVDLARIGFGHAVAVTMVGLLTAISSIINGGTSITPSFVNSIVASNGQTISLKNNASKRVVSESTSARIRAMMSQAVNKQEIRSFVPGYDIGGKTGTAQKYENGVIASGKYVSSFIGIYPAEKPEYILLIAVDEPSAGAYYGSLVAAPYGKMFFEQMFSILNIPPQDLEADLEKMEKNIVVPNLVGKGLATAVSELIECGLQYEIQGEGEIVQNQLLPAGSLTYKDDIVLLIT